jgi:hypothetical protein
VVCLFISTPSFFILGQTSILAGHVFDSNGSALPFANIYIIEADKGSSSNQDGYFEITLEAGTYNVKAQFVGYETLTQEIRLIAGQKIQIDFTLETKSFDLSQITIQGDRNPADEIMTQVIRARRDHYKRSKVREVDAYIKGSFRLKDAPEKFFGVDIGNIDSLLSNTPTDIIYLSETQSVFTSTLKWDKEKVLKSKTSGFSGLPSLNRASLLEINWYENEPNILSTTIKSPLADDAFSFYKYKLKGVQRNEAGNEIYLIQVVPKRKEDPLVTGTIEIVEKEWKISASRLSINEDRLNNELVDSLIIDQIYLVGENESVWPVIQTEVQLSLNAFNFQLDGNFTAVYSNIKRNPDEFTQSFDRVALEYDNEAFDHDSTNWREIRPIPLDSTEIIDYTYKDSIFALLNDSIRLDSLERSRNALKVDNLISGYSYSKEAQGTFLSISSPITNLLFNPIQGFHTSISADYVKREDPESITPSYKLTAKLNYGFSDHKWRYFFGGSTILNYKEPLELSFLLGDQLDQINNHDPISENANGFNNLIFKTHYIRFYRSRFVRLKASKRWGNGWEANGTMLYEHRNPLKNTTNYSVYLKEQTYPDNAPDHLDYLDNPDLMNTNDILKWEGNIRWKPGIRYWDLPNQRLLLNSGSWVLNFDYQVGVLNQAWENPFIWISLSSKKEHTFGLAGSSIWYAEAGGFLKNDQLSFYDYTHFHGNRFWLGDAEYSEDFLVLPYYRFSTNNHFVQIHWTHDFKSFLLNRIPYVRNLDFSVITKASYLHHPDVGHYNEFSIGLNRLGWGLFRIFRIDYTVALRNGNYFDWGLIFGSSVSLADLANMAG